MTIIDLPPEPEPETSAVADAVADTAQAVAAAVAQTSTADVVVLDRLAAIEAKLDALVVATAEPVVVEIEMPEGASGEEDRQGEDADDDSSSAMGDEEPTPIDVVPPVVDPSPGDESSGTPRKRGVRDRWRGK